MVKKVIIWVLAVLLVLAIVLVAAAPNLAFHLMLTKPKRSTKIPKFYQDSPHYKVSRAGMEKMKDYVEEDLYLTSRDGLKLHAYYYPNPEPSNKFVISVHGYRSYARPEGAPYIEFYREHGFNVLMVDDRAHAPSEGEYIGFGVLDRLDCVDWAKELVRLYGEDIEILLQGFSMGGATVLSASGEPDLPEQVFGIIGDCGFSNAWDVMHFQLEQMHAPADWLLPRIEKICEKKAGYNFHDHSALEQVKKAKVPILIVHGGKDTMVPPYMAQELYDAIPGEKRLLQVPEAGHAESIAFAPDEYHQAILEFFHIQ